MTRFRSPVLFRSWRKPPAKPRRTPVIEVPGTGITDLHDYLIRLLDGLHPACRGTAHWVMDKAWIAYAKQADAVLEHPALGDAGRFLLGLPVEVRPERLRWPYLEPDPTRVPPGFDPGSWMTMMPGEIGEALEHPPLQRLDPDDDTAERERR